MKRILPILCLLVLFSALLAPTLAAGGIESAVAGEIPDSQSPNKDMYELPDALQPENVLGADNITVDDLGNRLIRKGDDVVYLIKIVCRYICLGAFILSCVFIIVGIIGNRRMLVSSILAALIAGVCYAAITCGEQVVAFIAAWAAS